jgi:glycosyltransferase involved in cell wall biosynthesis
LYAGRGIEIVEALAAQRPRMLFLVYGGNDADVEARRASNGQSNLLFMGHVSHPIARQLMAAMDCLLMPYQQQVSIGVSGHDTANWMSPMKMFEYLASGVPIVASDLPSLREVLRDGANCLMVQPGSVAAWAAALDRIMAQPALARSIGRRAHDDYRDHYTWIRRAEALLNAARSR